MAGRMGFEPIDILRDRQTTTPSSLTSLKLWWVPVVTLHSPKDQFYRLTAETTDFRNPINS